MKTVNHLLSLCLVGATFLGLPAAYATGADTSSSLCLGQSVLDGLRYSDIRDQVRFRTELQGTANLIMKIMEANPGRFVGEVDSQGRSINPSSNTPVRFYREGAQGPKGHSVKAVVNERETQKFQITDDPVHTRKNSILGVEFENIVENECDKVFTIDTIMFIHDSTRTELADSNGHYFRRVRLLVDWNVPRSDESNRVQVIQHLADIPLANTNFSLIGDILERKVILEDKNHNIKKVFPVGVGALDIRTHYSMLDTVPEEERVTSMTIEHENSSVRAAVTTPDRNHTNGQNTRSRTWPAYYAGRPFIALFDSRGIYNEIGLHYQIEGDLRGFFSHGCIRVRDQDLYQLDAIVNEGTQTKFEANFLNVVDGYDDIDHPMPKVDSRYRVTVYSALPSEDKIVCPFRTHDVIKYTKNGVTFHTIADEECLTYIQMRSDNVRTAIDYAQGRTSQLPHALLINMDHIPLENEKRISERNRQAQDNWNNRQTYSQSQAERNQIQAQINQAANYVRQADDFAHRYCAEGRGRDRHRDCQVNRQNRRAWYQRYLQLQNQLY